jgi:Cu-processing system permease protein
MGVIGVIAVNAFRESLRDKILYNLVLFAGLLIGLSVVLADLSITEHHKVIADMGLAAINLIGVIIAMFVGISLVNKEIERRTIYTIMARPISRSCFIIGKYFGLALTLLVNMSVMLAVFLFTLWLYHVPIEPSLFQAVQLMFVEILVVTAIALFFSTFTSSTLSAIFTLGLYVIGHLTADLRAMVANSAGGIGKAVVDPAVLPLPQSRDAQYQRPGGGGRCGGTGLHAARVPLRVAVRGGVGDGGLSGVSAARFLIHGPAASVR